MKEILANINFHHRKLLRNIDQESTNYFVFLITCQKVFNAGSSYNFKLSPYIVKVSNRYLNILIIIDYGLSRKVLFFIILIVSLKT